jgi:hypothetical protein
MVEAHHRVEFSNRVMHGVKAPQDGNCVLQAVKPIIEEIEHKCTQEDECYGYNRVVCGDVDDQQRRRAKPFD